MAIVVGDIHGNVEKVKAFLAYRPDQLHVALGDYCDSFFEPVERQLECLRLLLESDAVLLWGNHDLHYLDKSPFVCSNYQQEHAGELRKMIEANKHRFKAAWAVDGWLCTHGGVSVWMAEGEDDPDRLAQRLNQEMDMFLARPGRRRQGLFTIGMWRGGNCLQGGGIFWFDTLYETCYLATQLRQITGHTKQEASCNPHLVTLETSDVDHFCWLYDTAAAELVSVEMPHKRIRNLPEHEQEPFCLYLFDRDQPHLADVPPEELDGYWPEDYKRWVSLGRPRWDLIG